MPDLNEWYSQIYRHHYHEQFAYDKIVAYCDHDTTSSALMVYSADVIIEAHYVEEFLF